MKEIKKKRYVISYFIYFSVCILTLTDIMKLGMIYLKNHFAQSNIYMEMLIGFVTLIIFFVKPFRKQHHYYLLPYVTDTLICH